MRRNYSLILVVCWLVIAAALFFPELFPEGMRKHLKNAGGGLLGMLALMFAAYNGARWWAIRNMYRNRSEARRVNPLSVRTVEKEKEPEPYQPNPELNFIKLPEDEKKPDEPTP